MAEEVKKTSLETHRISDAGAYVGIVHTAISPKMIAKRRSSKKRKIVLLVFMIVAIIGALAAGVYFIFFWSPFSRADIDKAAQVTQVDVEVYTEAEAAKYIKMTDTLKQVTDTQKMARTRAYIILGQNDKAITELESMKTETKNAMGDSYYYLLGYIAEQGNDKAQAIDMYKKGRLMYLEKNTSPQDGESDDASVLADYNARIVNLGGTLQ